MDLFAEAYALALMVFLYRLLGGKREWLFWAAAIPIFADFILTMVNIVPWMISPYWLILDTLPFNTLHALLFLPFTAWVLVFIGRNAFRGRTEARLLLPAIALEAICSLVIFLTGFNANQYEWMRQNVLRWFLYVSSWPIPFSVQSLTDLLMLLSMLGVLVYRFTRTRLHEESYEREREAARTVQQVLIPQALPDILGFQIASVYRPFAEVGGDFFQILPIDSGTHGGSVVIAIGDVSGKGLPAVMTVSLLVGTVRTLAHYTQSPAEILSAMNLRMVGRSSGGFTTCLVLRVDLNGTLTIANAGHVAPYLNGRELQTKNGLPLGLIRDTTYAESTYDLSQNEQLTLMTDGVVEARSKSGELFGFERTQSVSQQSPESIAHAAQHFGQDDDITVLSLCRT